MKRQMDSRRNTLGLAAIAVILCAAFLPSLARGTDTHYVWCEARMYPSGNLGGIYYYSGVFSVEGSTYTGTYNSSFVDYLRSHYGDADTSVVGDGCFSSSESASEARSERDNNAGIDRQGHQVIFTDWTYE
jgi:hypothetical protein